MAGLVYEGDLHVRRCLLGGLTLVFILVATVVCLVAYTCIGRMNGADELII
jgi:hypothetical protein